MNKFLLLFYYKDKSKIKIQIRVHAVGVNPIDTYIRTGTHNRKPNLPYTPGLDSAGIIIQFRLK